MPEYVFKTAGNVRFEQRVVTWEGAKPLGDCRLFNNADMIRCRNPLGEEFWLPAVNVVATPSIEIALAQED